MRRRTTPRVVPHTSMKHFETSATRFDVSKIRFIIIISIRFIIIIILILIRFIIIIILILIRFIIIIILIRFIIIIILIRFSIIILIRFSIIILIRFIIIILYIIAKQCILNLRGLSERLSHQIIVVTRDMQVGGGVWKGWRWCLEGLKVVFGGVGGGVWRGWRWCLEGLEVVFGGVGSGV